MQSSSEKMVECGSTPPTFQLTQKKKREGKKKVVTPSINNTPKDSPISSENVLM